MKASWSSTIAQLNSTSCSFTEHAPRCNEASGTSKLTRLWLAIRKLAAETDIHVAAIVAC